MSHPLTIVFVCSHNSGRSQAAAAWEAVSEKELDLDCRLATLRAKRSTDLCVAPTDDDDLRGEPTFINDRAWIRFRRR
jgi:hypothetical protein